MTESFDELRASVKRHVGDTPAFLEFDLEIGTRSTEVQRALDESATWFSKADPEVQKQRFKLDQVVRIAIEAALKCQRAFDPQVNSHVENGELQAMTSTLVFVHDVLFVALDNVRAHSGIESPAVDIYVKPDIESSSLSIEVISDMKRQVRVSQEAKLQEIRKLINDGKFDRRSRGEGGTGFIKLAAEVERGANRKIEFGVTPSGRFRLCVIDSLDVVQ